MTKQSI